MAICNECSAEYDQRVSGGELCPKCGIIQYQEGKKPVAKPVVKKEAKK